MFSTLMRVISEGSQESLDTSFYFFWGSSIHSFWDLHQYPFSKWFQRDSFHILKPFFPWSRTEIHVKELYPKHSLKTFLGRTGWSQLRWKEGQKKQSNHGVSQEKFSRKRWVGIITGFHHCMIHPPIGLDPISESDQVEDEGVVLGSKRNIHHDSGG